MKSSGSLFLTLTLIVAGCTSSTTTTTGVPTTDPVAATTVTQTGTPAPTTTAPQVPPSTTTTTLPTEVITTGAQPRALQAFASLHPVPMRETSSLRWPDPPASMDAVSRPSYGELDPATETTLLSNGFAIEPAGFSQFQHAYSSYLYAGETFFVTTDVGYHYLHLVFSKLLRDVEQTRLLPILDHLAKGLVDQTRAQQGELAGTDLADAADHAAQLAEAAATLLGLDVGPIGPLAQQEVDLALEAAQMVASPTTSFGDCRTLASAANCVDYSLFKPRGHYTRNDELERYFRGMSLFGQAAFAVSEPQSLRIGALLGRALLQDPRLVEDWQLIYEPTAFMVGLADDYTLLELATAADGEIPGWTEDPSLLTTDAMQRISSAMSAERAVGIDPEAASVRIMGARFVIDSYIFDQMRFPSVGDPPFGRVSASPLDLVATYGSDLAYRLQRESGQTAFTNYDDQLDRMTAMLDDRTPDDWATTVYDAWLYALQPVWKPHGTGFPSFMRSEAWAAKDMQTGLGSYAELKHDTILYAKQSFAAEGGFEPPPVPPRHWVEPNPTAFARMASVLELVRDGLTERSLLQTNDNLFVMIEDVHRMLDRLARIAGEELDGRPISNDDNEWLESIGPILEGLWVATSDWDAALGMPSADDTDAAIIADIMRSTSAYLEIGTGRIDRLYVIVPDDAGNLQLAQGGVYSYYEFWQPAADGRLTDEEWRELLGTADEPERPDWQQMFLPGAEATPAGLPGGLLCADITAKELPYVKAIAYWIAEGMPDRMDADGNGVPCETVYAAGEVTDYFDPVPATSGLFCRDLQADGHDYSSAVAYWLQQGAPARMDADENGIPCETVYSRSEVDAFYRMWPVAG